MIKRLTSAPTYVYIIAFAVALMILLSSCTGASEAQVEGQKQTEQAFEQQSSAVPYPASELRDSLERKNLREKLLRQNKADAVGYVYIYSFGQVQGYYVIKGKISSTQSQMTTDQLIARPCDTCDRYVVNAPGDDGSYGLNEPGVFFFLTNGTMVETNLDYVFSDQPMALDVPNLGEK